MRNKLLTCLSLKTLDVLCMKDRSAVGEIITCPTTLHDFFRGSLWLVSSRKIGSHYSFPSGT